MLTNWSQLERSDAFSGKEEMFQSPTLALYKR